MTGLESTKDYLLLNELRSRGYAVFTPEEVRTISESIKYSDSEKAIEELKHEIHEVSGIIFT